MRRALRKKNGQQIQMPRRVKYGKIKNYLKDLATRGSWMIILTAASS